MSIRNRQNLISFSVFVVLTVSIALLSALPQPGASSVVVFVSPAANGSHALEVIAQADGTLMNSGSAPWIALAASSNPDFISDLYQAGALFVGSGQLFSACFPDPRPHSPISPISQSALTTSSFDDWTRGFQNARFTDT